MNERMKKINTKKFSVILLVLFAIVITIFLSSYIIFNELKEQLWQNLDDVATQNSLALHNKIHSNYELLLSLSENMHNATPENIDEKLQSFNIFLNEYNLKRFAYCFPDGTSYSTDGGVANLSYREFFKRGMKGKATISGILEDALEDSHGLVNVMTIPIYNDNGEVEGVFGLTYNSQSFNDALQIECFDGKGYSCAINSDGQILVAMGNDTLQMSENIFTDLLDKDQQNTEAIEKLQKQIQENISGGGTFYLSEKSYYSCVPVKLMDGDVTWYMLTIIPADVLEGRAAPIQNSLYVMAFIVAILILMGASFVIKLSWEQKSMMLRYAYEDPLTKGANYAKFCVEMNKKRDIYGYLISMDITHFNNINIAAGKSAGNYMISDIWQIINAELQNEELASHVGEDVFSIFLKTKDKKLLIERLKNISTRINKQARKLQVRGLHSRYGIYEINEDDEVEDAFSKAQLAREQARSQKDPRYVFYNEMDHEKLQQNQRLEERFDESIAKGHFEIWYQPKYSTATGKIVGSEALVRWRDTDGSLISPGVFIPLFEQNGMIVKLDEYVFRSVCKQQAQWLDSISLQAAS